MRLLRASRKSCGNTLPEAVIAIAILGITAAAVIGSFNLGLFLTGIVRENQRATQALLENLETIRLYSWSQVTSNGFIPTSFTNYYDPQAVSGSQGVAYRGTMVITNFPYSTSYSTNLRQLTVTLKWQGTGNLLRQRQVSTYIAKDGMQNYVY